MRFLRNSELLLEWQSPSFLGFLLALCVYLASSYFVSYWPFCFLQFVFVALSEGVSIESVGQRFKKILFLMVFLGSLIVGAGLVAAEGGRVLTWSGLIYAYAHVVWLVVHLKERKGMLFFLRVSVFLCLLFFSIINSGYLFENQLNIAILEFLLSVLLFSVFGFFNRGWRVFFSFFLVVSGVLTASNLFAVWDGVSFPDWWRVAQVLGHLVLSWALVVWLRADNLAIHWVVGAVLGGVVLYFIVLAKFWLGLDNPKAFDWFAFPPLYEHIRHLGYFLCVGLVVAAWSVFFYGGRLRFLSWLVYVLVMSMLLWSGGRGAFLAAVGGIATLAVMAPPVKFSKVWSWILIGFLLSLILSAFFAVDHLGLGWLSAWIRSENADSLNRLSSSRLWIWKTLLPFIGERPWFGWGGEAFRTIWSFGKISQAHNGLFQVLLEWGGIGALVIFIPLGVFFWRGARDYWRAEEGTVSQAQLALGVTIVLSLLLLSLVDGVFYYGTPSAFLAVGFALLTVCNCSKRKETYVRTKVGPLLLFNRHQ